MDIEPNTEHALPRHARGADFLVVARSVVAGLRERGTGLLVASLMALVAVTKFGQTLHTDVAWYVYSAGAFLDGGRLYDDVFFEMNPPLMLYLTVPGVMLARSTGLFAADGYLLTLFAAVGFSLWSGARMLAPQHRLTWSLLSFFALVVLPAGDFGQRSHLMVILGLPYVLLLAHRLHDRKADFGTLFTIAVGASAGLGFAIKPHFLLVPAILELLLWCRTGRRLPFVRPETLALCAVVALYVAVIVIFTPGYLTRIVPYALEVYQTGYRNPLLLVLARPETLLVPILVGFHWHKRRALTPQVAAMGDVFSLSAVTLFAVYVMQMKGWNYHVYPATAMLMMLAGMLFTAPSAVSRPARAMVFALAVALLSKAAVLSESHRPLESRLLPFIRAHASDSIYLFSANISPGFPMALYADVRWASRFPSLWLIPGIERRRAASPDSDMKLLAEIDRFTTDAVVADLSQQRPEIVFVDVRPWKPWQAALEFDFIARFSADPRFAALWARYERIAEVDGFEVYRLRSDDVSEVTRASWKPPRPRTS
jgi:hypothetical protein